MKKLIKLIGLLFFSGLMFVGCQQNANSKSDNVEIETDNVELSDGTWDYTLSITFFTEKKWMTISGNDKINGIYKFNNGIGILTNGSETGNATYKFSESASQNYIDDINAENKDKGMTLLSVDGNSYSYKYDRAFDSNETETASVGEINDFCKKNNAVVKTNKKKTEYKITFSETTYDENFKDTNGYTLTLKKK